MTALVRRSPLAAHYRARKAAIEKIDDWEMVRHCGDPEAERRALAEGSVLVDWSHIGKIQIRGRDAAEQAERLWSGAADLARSNAVGDDSLAVLRLAPDEFLVLCEAGRRFEHLARLEEGSSAICDCSGALGALLLAGTRRDEVIERSAAMDLSARALALGSVVQTTLHTIPCTVYRASDWDLYLQARDYTESLYDALMDVGRGVGLVAAGLACVPASLRAGGDHA
jgi:heterotetrameric sarcosine oxidase gamma subunit